jgi:hypothetical protein
MSKLFISESITTLRKELSEANTIEEFLSNRFSNGEFDLSDLRLKNDESYPELNNKVVEDIKSFWITTIENNNKDEWKLAKYIHDNLSISKEQAANNLYWIYLSLKHFIDPVLVEIGKVDDVEKKKNEFEELIFLTSSAQGPMLKSPLAGLWWSVEITKNNQISGPYFYTELFLRNRHLRFKNLGGHQIIRSPHILEALLDFIYKYEEQEANGERIGHEAISQAAAKTLNQIGGLVLLSFLTKEEVLQKIEDYKSLIFGRAYEIRIGKKRSRLMLQGKSVEHLMDEKYIHEEQENLSEENIVINETIGSDRDISFSSNGKDVVKEQNSTYFQLNKTSGQYRLSKSMGDDKWDSNIVLDLQNSNEYLIHFYKEGKIKKSNYDELKHKKIGALYSNGKNRKLSLLEIVKIQTPVLFGVTYKKSGKIYFKALNEADSEMFRTDNGSLMQEGKKIIYQSYDQIWYKILPHDIIHDLGTLVQKPLGKGKDVTNDYYEEQWSVLKGYWPEMFDL